MAGGPAGHGVPRPVPVRVDVEYRAGVTIVRLAGTLTMQTAPAVRGRLLKCLADCPDALIVDVADLATESDGPLTVLRVVQRQAHRWPGIPMLLCRPDSALAEQLTRPGPDRYPPFHPSIERAIAALDRPVLARPTIHTDLLSTPEACPRARDVVFHACQDWDLANAADPAELVVSELVSNAVRHGWPPLHLLLAVRGERLHIAVRDGNPALPQASPAAPPPSVPSGRGLHLINTLATAWGAMPSTDGKVVWATLRAAP